MLSIDLTHPNLIPLTGHLKMGGKDPSGRAIDDDFYSGRTWEIGLRRFAPEVLQAGLTLRFLPLRKDAPNYLPPGSWPDFGSAPEIVQVRSIGVQIEYGIKIRKE